MKLEMTPPGLSTEKISPRKKFEIILGLFGSDKARENFIALCKEYDQERSEQVVLSGDAENYKHGDKKIPYSPPKRAHLHNKVMETIAKLATQSKKLTPLQEAVLRDLHSRENAAQAIHKYLLEGHTADDEEDEIRKKGGQSEVAYFHSLGKEH